MKKNKSWNEFSRKGGLATKKNHGVEYYKNLAVKGNAAIVAKYGPEYYKNLAKLGLAARMKKRNKSTIKKVLTRLEEHIKIPLDNATASVVE